MKIVGSLVVLAATALSGAALGKDVTLAELRKHNTETDCWMVIEGTVYDVSQFIKLHREECKKMNFIELCGTDASSAWKKKESGDSPHKKKSQRELLKSKVGNLVTR